MKSIAEYIDDVYGEYINTNFSGHIGMSDTFPYESLLNFAMQSRKQDHDIEMAHLYARLKRSAPATDKQLNYIRTGLTKTETQQGIFLEYLKNKDCDLTKLSEVEASELIEKLLEVKDETTN